MHLMRNSGARCSPASGMTLQRRLELRASRWAPGRPGKVLDDRAEEEDVAAQELQVESRIARSMCRSSSPSGSFCLLMPYAWMTVITARMPKS